MTDVRWGATGRTPSVKMERTVVQDEGIGAAWHRGPVIQLHPVRRMSNRVVSVYCGNFSPDIGSPQH
jgi:hypothetical protein